MKPPLEIIEGGVRPAPAAGEPAPTAVAFNFTHSDAFAPLAEDEQLVGLVRRDEQRHAELLEVLRFLAERGKADRGTKTLFLPLG